MSRRLADPALPPPYLFPVLTVKENPILPKSPPLSLYRKTSGPQYHEKRPKFARQTGSENRVARYVE